MPLLIERWISGPSWVRCVSLLIFVGLITLGAWFFLIAPQQFFAQQLATQNHQAYQNVATLSRKIRQLTLPEPRAAKAETLEFSVMAFISQSDGQLVKWQPEERRGVLEMLVPWEKLPGLFTRLAKYHAVVGQTFSLTPQGELLRVVLTIEFSDEA